MSISNLEQTYVINTYKIIASDFDKTRTYLWKSIKEYIMKIPKHSIILEAGCGNGKNAFRKDIIYTGIDLSISMNKICQDKDINTITSNILKLPFKDSYFDFVFSIAVIHHLDSFEKRLNAIKELVRVTKINKNIFIQVWKFDKQLIISKKNKIKSLNTKNDYLIEWPYKNRMYYRYYHLFDKIEILDILSNISNISIESYYTEKQNLIIILKKK